MSRRLERQFLNPSEISRHLWCSICKDVYLEPTRLFCSHVFCKKCITHWQDNNKSCPICRETIDVLLMGRDQTAYKIIQDLPVECCNNLCTWQGTLEGLESHYRSCQFTVTPDWVKNPPDCIKIEEENTSETQIMASKTFPLLLQRNIQPLFQIPVISSLMNMPFLDNNYLIFNFGNFDSTLTFPTLPYANSISLNFPTNESNFLLQDYYGQNESTSEIDGLINENSYLCDKTSTIISSKPKKKKKTIKTPVVRKLSTRPSFSDENEEEEYSKVKIKKTIRTSKRRGNQGKISEEGINIEKVKKKVKKSS